MCSLEIWDQLNSFWRSLHRPFLLPKTLLTVTSLAALCPDPKPGSKDISLYITCPCLTIQPIYSEETFLICPSKKKKNLIPCLTIRPIYSEETFLICPSKKKNIFNHLKADIIILHRHFSHKFVIWIHVSPRCVILLIWITVHYYFL